MCFAKPLIVTNSLEYYEICWFCVNYESGLFYSTGASWVATWIIKDIIYLTMNKLRFDWDWDAQYWDSVWMLLRFYQQGKSESRVLDQSRTLAYKIIGLRYTTLSKVIYDQDPAREDDIKWERTKTWTNFS